MFSLPLSLSLCLTFILQRITWWLPQRVFALSLSFNSSTNYKMVTSKIFRSLSLFLFFNELLDGYLTDFSLSLSLFILNRITWGFPQNVFIPTLSLSLSHNYSTTNYLMIPSKSFRSLSLFLFFNELLVGFLKMFSFPLSLSLPLTFILQRIPRWLPQRVFALSLSFFS